MRSVEALETVAARWAQQGLRVERGGLLLARCRGEVVEIPCELLGRAEDGSARVCVGGRVEEFGREEVVV